MKLFKKVKPVPAPKIIIKNFNQLYKLQFQSEEGFLINGSINIYFSVSLYENEMTEKIKEEIKYTAGVELWNVFNLLGSKYSVLQFYKEKEKFINAANLRLFDIFKNTKIKYDHICYTSPFSIPEGIYEEIKKNFREKNAKRNNKK